MSLWNSAANTELRLVHDEPTGDPEVDLMAGIQLLSEVRDGRKPQTLRLYRPDPTLAFGQRDVRLPGYEDAVRKATEHGFAPVIRKAGGRAAAYHRGCLIVDHVELAEEAMLGHQQRFKILGQLYADALRSAGVDAHVGEIPGEYCPGEFSVHGSPSLSSPTKNKVKLVGTAQRVVGGAWLFSSVFVIEASAPIAAVLDDVYKAMDIPMNPATAGAAEDLLPGLSVEKFSEKLIAEYRKHTRVLDPS